MIYLFIIFPFRFLYIIVVSFCMLCEFFLCGDAICFSCAVCTYQREKLCFLPLTCKRSDTAVIVGLQRVCHQEWKES